MDTIVNTADKNKIKSLINQAISPRRGRTILKGVSYARFLEITSNNFTELIDDLFIWYDDYEDDQNNKIRIATIQPNLGHKQYCIKISSKDDKLECTFYNKIYIEVHTDAKYNERDFDDDDDAIIKRLSEQKIRELIAKNLIGPQIKKEIEKWAENELFDLLEKTKKDERELFENRQRFHKEMHERGTTEIPRLINAINKRYSTNYEISEIRNLFSGNPYSTNRIQILVPVKCVEYLTISAENFLKMICGHERSFYETVHKNKKENLLVDTNFIDMKNIHIYEFLIDCINDFRKKSNKADEEGYRQDFHISEYLD